MQGFRCLPDLCRDHSDCLAGLRTNRGVQPIRELGHLTACTSPAGLGPRYVHLGHCCTRKGALDGSGCCPALLNQVFAHKSLDLGLQLFDAGRRHAGTARTL
jgi:hypothetical protein